MKRLDLTKKDFEWVDWGVDDIKKLPEKIISSKKKTYQELKNISASERTFKNIMYKLEGPDEYENEGTFISFLMNVSPKKEIREAAFLAINEIEQASIELAYDEDVYLSIRDYIKNREKDLDDQSKLLIKDTLRGYKRMGFGKSIETRNQIKEIGKELSLLTNEFEKNLNEYKDFIIISKNETSGLPTSYIDSLNKDKNGNYIVTLENPDIIPFLKFSDLENKRKELSEKNYRKGGERNIEILKKVVVLRDKLSGLLGYESYPDYVLEVKMVKNPKQVLDFLGSLKEKLSEKTINEKKELEKIKGSELKFYDLAYYSEKHKEKTFSLDSEKLKEYFPVEKVMKGMFDIYETLLDVKFVKSDKFKMWHEDVDFYEVKEDGKVVSYFATDLYPRDGKYGHYAMFSIIQGQQIDYPTGDYQMPFSSIVGNFPKPTSGNPSLLTHRDVETMFHEFGHVMHSILTKARYASQSGTSVAGDFVEAPSQMLEYWVWDRDMLKKMSGHFKTGEELPDDVIDNLLKSKGHLKGLFYTRQINLALFDMKLHTEVNIDPVSLYKNISESSIGIKLPEDQLWPAGFGHIIHGYQCGYYGYLWSEVYATDMFSVFKEKGLLDIETGKKYREWVLEKGGSVEEIDILRGFLDREPNEEAFIKEIDGE